jgi:hypothetical protein
MSELNRLSMSVRRDSVMQRNRLNDVFAGVADGQLGKHLQAAH